MKQISIFKPDSKAGCSTATVIRSVWQFSYHLSPHLPLFLDLNHKIVIKINFSLVWYFLPLILKSLIQNFFILIKIPFSKIVCIVKAKYKLKKVFITNLHAPFPSPLLKFLLKKEITNRLL